MNFAQYTTEILLGLALAITFGLFVIENARRRAAQYEARLTNRLISSMIAESHEILDLRKNGHAPVEDTRTPYRPADTDPMHHVS